MTQFQIIGNLWFENLRYARQFLSNQLSCNDVTIRNQWASMQCYSALYRWLSGREFQIFRIRSRLKRSIEQKSFLLTIAKTLKKLNSARFRLELVLRNADLYSVTISFQVPTISESFNLLETATIYQNLPKLSTD